MLVRPLLKRTMTFWKAFAPADEQISSHIEHPRLQILIHLHGSIPTLTPQRQIILRNSKGRGREASHYA